MGFLRCSCSWPVCRLRVYSRRRLQDRHCVGVALTTVVSLLLTTPMLDRWPTVKSPTSQRPTGHPHRVFGIKQADWLFHKYVIGKTGTGKSTLLETVALQDIAHGRGV